MAGHSEAGGPTGRDYFSPAQASLLGILSDPHAPRLETDAAYQEAVEHAWDAAAMEAY